ncbi:MAG: helix-turn-helix domain-containing protein [Bacteroidales bacterium]
MTEKEFEQYLNKNYMTFPEYLDFLAKKKSVFIEQCAEACGVSTDTIRRWGNGTLPPKLAREKIAQILCRRVQELFPEILEENENENTGRETLRNA